MIPFECLTVDFEKYHTFINGKVGTEPAIRPDWDGYVYWPHGADRDTGAADSEAAARLFAGWQALRAKWARPDDPPSVRVTLDILASGAQARDHLGQKEPDSAGGLSTYAHREVQLILSYFEWRLEMQRAEYASSLIRVEPIEEPHRDIKPEIVSNLVATPNGADAPLHEIPIVS